MNRNIMISSLERLSYVFLTEEQRRKELTWGNYKEASLTDLCMKALNYKLF